MNHEDNGGPQTEPADCVNPPSGPFYVRIYPHIIRRTDGSGGVSAEVVSDAITRLNSVYNILGIYFVVDCGDFDDMNINYIDDDTEDEYFRKGIIKHCELFNEFKHGDGIDIFFDDPDIFFSGGSNSANDVNIGGYAVEFSNTGCVIGGTWPTGIVSAESHIVSHEVGHCLGLFHTHHAYEEAFTNPCTGNYWAAGELDDETNCDSKGDKCCQTPFDPGLDNKVNVDCVWTEPDGVHNPDTRNIMASTRVQCMSWLTYDQGERMRCELQENSYLRPCVIPAETALTISENTIWSSLTVPHDGDFVIADVLVIESGNSLTINSEVTVKFAENAKLIIEPNAALHLYGTLTSMSCNHNWSGVKVYGNAEESQYLDSGVYHHGALHGYPGSLIENAVTGVELWGPDPEDTGGRILCTETEFKNNAIGVSFLPYNNFKGDQPHPYVARFKECTFRVDDGFNLPVFHQHVALYGVDGLRFTGCKFGNMSSSADHDFQHEYGYGIAAVDAGFIVSASTVAPENPEPCIPGSCTVQQRSVFKGLGYGIWTGSIESNRLFRVYQADFEDCYTGIEVEGVSGGVMLFNEFNMGTVPDPEIMNGDQIGIKLNHQLAGFTIEENSFTGSSGNTNHTIGISAENLGEMSNVIRKNTFSGLTLANEAFGVNAGEDQLGIIGLRYICNINTTISDKDFFVKNTEYGTDKISTLQAGIASNGSSIASGNQFSSAGDADDGDFANYGVEIDEYHYYQSSGVQVPDDFQGIASIVPAVSNPCSQEYCAPPCLTSNDLANLNDEYFEFLSFYEGFIGESEWSKAAASKSLMDRASRLIVQHYYVDSTSFHRDSLRAWYGRIRTVSGDILLAKDYASESDYTTARQVLANMPARFTLTTPVVNDLADIDTIFGMLDARGFSGLTQGDIDDLVGFSVNKGHSASMARSLLTLNGYRFETQYVLPDPDPEPFIWLPENPVSAFDGFTIYPNPNSGDLLNVHVSEMDERVILFSLSSIHGVEVLSENLTGYLTNIILPARLPAGVYVYHIYREAQAMTSGRLILIP